MDALIATIAGLTVALTGLAASATAGIRHELIPYLGRRSRMRALADDLDRLAAERTTRPAPHPGAHCPACGRFARVTSDGERGTWTRCAACGIRLRTPRRIGRREAALVEVTGHHPIIPLPVPPPLPSPSDVVAPLRAPDWLDAVESTA